MQAADEHATHGRDGAEDFPNASHCPCAGRATDKVQAECAASGCRYCRVWGEVQRKNALRKRAAR